MPAARCVLAACSMPACMRKPPSAWQTGSGLPGAHARHARSGVAAGAQAHVRAPCPARRGRRGEAAPVAVRGRKRQQRAGRGPVVGVHRRGRKRVPLAQAQRQVPQQQQQPAAADGLILPRARAVRARSGSFRQLAATHAACLQLQLI